MVRNGYLPERIDHHGHRAGEGAPAARARSPRRTTKRSLFPPRFCRLTCGRRGASRSCCPGCTSRGFSTGDFNEALQALVGPECPGLSASTVTRLLEGWQAEYHEWSKRSLKDKHYVYLWVDGVHFNIRLEEDRQCILVLMGATADGQKELIAIADGYRESEQSWMELLLDVKSRGLVDRSQAGHRRRGFGILEGTAEGLPDHPHPALLGPQDGQRPRQAAQAIAATSQRSDPRHLDGRHTRGGQPGVRLVPGNLRREVPEGLRVPGQGP